MTVQELVSSDVQYRSKFSFLSHLAFLLQYFGENGGDVKMHSTAKLCSKTQGIFLLMTLVLKFLEF